MAYELEIEKLILENGNLAVEIKKMIENFNDSFKDETSYMIKQGLKKLFKEKKLNIEKLELEGKFDEMKSEIKKAIESIKTESGFSANFEEKLSLDSEGKFGTYELWDMIFPMSIFMTLNKHKFISDTPEWQKIFDFSLYTKEIQNLRHAIALKVVEKQKNKLKLDELLIKQKEESYIDEKFGDILD